MAIYLSEKLKQFRKARNLTQEQVADIFNVSPQTVSRWETGTNLPDIDMLPAIADFFEATVDDLLGVDIAKKEARIIEILRGCIQSLLVPLGGKHLRKRVCVCAIIIFVSAEVTVIS